MPLAADVLPSAAATPAQKQQDLATIHGYTIERSRRRYATNPHLVAAQPAVGPNCLPETAGRRRPPPMACPVDGDLPALARRRIRRRALLSGIIADAYGIPVAVTAVAALTGASGIVVALRTRGTDEK